MNIEIFKNILLLILILFLFLLISNDEDYNKYIKKNKINYLVLLILVYFIYIEIPLSIVVLFLLIILILNKNFYSKYLKENKYLKNYLSNFEKFDNKKELENFDFSPYKDNKADNKIVVEEETKNEINEPKKEEPFKSKVQEIKEHLNNAIKNNK